jgi:class 3 adenylate cyclase
MAAPAPLRKSLALVFCDIVDSARLFAQEGDLVASTVLRDFFEHTGCLGQECHCLMIKFIGDAFLAAFENIGSVMPFVSSVRRLPWEDPAFTGRQLSFRFSIHYGEVVYMETSYGTDVLGEDVNVAARLNELAEPDQIVVSQAALDRMPRDQRDRAGPSEFREFKRVGNVEFRRIDLPAL